MSGNLGYQVEHHLYPDMPSSRYAEIAPRVQEICERYEPALQHRPVPQAVAMVQRTILRLAFPGGKPRPKPGPYRGEGPPESSNGHYNVSQRAPAGSPEAGPEQPSEGVRVSLPPRD